MSNIVVYILLSILAILSFLVIRRQMSLKIPRIIDEVLVPYASTMKKSNPLFGAGTPTDYYPTLVSSTTTDFSKSSLNFQSDLKYSSSTKILSVPKVDADVIGNADTATAIKGGSCCKLLIQRGVNSTNLLENGPLGYVLTSNGPNAEPSFKPIPGGSQPEDFVVLSKTPYELLYAQAPNVMLDLLSIILPVGQAPQLGSVSGFIWDAAAKQLKSTAAGRYIIYMNVQFSTTNSVQKATPKIRVNSVDKYSGAVLTSGAPVSNQFYSAPNIIIDITGPGQLLQVGVIVTGFSTGQKTSTIRIIKDSMIRIQKI